jgi:hypothetical protein
MVVPMIFMLQLVACEGTIPALDFIITSDSDPNFLFNIKKEEAYGKER